MKKKISGKLQLNKTVISNLENSEMSGIKGGETNQVIGGSACCQTNDDCTVGCVYNGGGTDNPTEIEPQTNVGSLCNPDTCTESMFCGD